MRTILVVLALVAMCLSGCGVYMNPTYSNILDKTVALSDATAKTATDGKLTPADMTTALQLQAQTWHLFQDARDGKAPASSIPASK